MTSKKKATSKVKKFRAVPFNKKNVLALADQIFSEKNDSISMLKLCEGNLSSSRGGQTMHCAVGEAYATFISPYMSKLNKLEDYESKYFCVEPEAGTAKAIDRLVEVAHLKNKAASAKEDLAAALSDIVSENDMGEGEPTTDTLLVYIKRSQRVADAFRKFVAPMLK